MKLKDLKSVLYSNRGNIQFAIVYDSRTNADIESGCSIDYAVEQHGEKELIRIEAFENKIILVV